MLAPAIPSIHPRELGSLPRSTRFIDVREPAEFEAPLGHLPHSELVPFSMLLASAQAWRADAPLLLICRSGARSLRAALLLAEKGFTALYNLEGGMLAVREAGLAVEGPDQEMHMTAFQVREAFCAAVRELYRGLLPPSCESLFEKPSAFSHPGRPSLLGALSRLEAQAQADGLAQGPLTLAVRQLRDAVALIQEPGASSS